MGKPTKAKGIGELVARDASGKFVPGNPGGPGRPKMDPKVRAMLEAKTPHAVKRLLEALDANVVVHWQGVEVGIYVDHDMRVRAAEALLNRLYGKPAQIAQLDGDGKVTALGVIILPGGGEGTDGT